jgi:hypothetical protein
MAPSFHVQRIGCGQIWLTTAVASTKCNIRAHSPYIDILISVPSWAKGQVTIGDVMLSSSDTVIWGLQYPDNFDLYNKYVSVTKFHSGFVQVRLQR